MKQYDFTGNRQMIYKLGQKTKLLDNEYRINERDEEPENENEKAKIDPTHTLFTLKLHENKEICKENVAVIQQ